DVRADEDKDPPKSSPGKTEAVPSRIRRRLVGQAEFQLGSPLRARDTCPRGASEMPGTHPRPARQRNPRANRQNGWFYSGLSKYMNHCRIWTGGLRSCEPLSSCKWHGTSCD